MEYKDLIVEKAEGILTITLNRPQALNSFSDEVYAGLNTLMDQASEDAEVRAVIVTGAGRGFCAGVDFGVLDRMMDQSTADFRREIVWIQQSLFKMERLEKPVIAAINGAAAGGGFELALVCDLRIASTEARLGFTEVRIGIIPDMGGTKRLSRVVGYGVAKELIMTGRFLSADEALRLGILSAVVPPNELLPRAKDLARELMANAPMAVGLAKRVIDLGFDADMNTAFQFEVYAQSILHGSEDLREGVRAFREKRAPRFQGR